MSRIIRAILPDWAKVENESLSRVREGIFTDKEIKTLNHLGYNIFYLPNYPSVYDSTKNVDGSMVDKFNVVFIDVDLKDKVYSSKEEFIDKLGSFDLLPSRIVDSGGGIHAYWKVSDLDAMSYLRLSRRLMRLFKSDEAVGQLYQLMRLPGTTNNKIKENPRFCEEILNIDTVYSAEQLDQVLPPITAQDEAYCQQHYNKTYKINQPDIKIDDKIPLKFAQLIRDSKEAKDIWSGQVDDRSKGDYRLAHLMFANSFTRDEALSVLVNSSKAIARAPQHRISYATNIVDKIWTFETTNDTSSDDLSSSVEEILSRQSKEDLAGTRFPCNPIVDGTNAGFKLGQVFGLVGGSGIGKTTFALNLFRWFVEQNPDYIHFFVSLEQPVEEISERWVAMCGDNKRLHSKVQVLGNYDKQGRFRDLSLTQIKDYILQFQTKTGKKVGCVVLDHIGVLKMDSKNGETEDLRKICKGLKSFALETNTFFVVQSQTSREKAGIGDLELNKDAAFGTAAFENYCDFLVTIWAPLKRIYDQAPNMTVTAFKFCKIRKKNVKLDRIKEDVRYTLMFDVDSEHYRPLTQLEEKSFIYFNSQATTLRKQDRKTDVLEYKSLGTTGIDQ
jgi:KaiC/GvpD/RAD55 family RecA-like ATPase